VFVVIVDYPANLVYAVRSLGVFVVSISIMLTAAQCRRR